MRALPKIYECVDGDNFRPAMDYALIKKDETVATNAHILVVHASSELFDTEFLESLPDDGILVGKEALKDMSKKDTQRVEFLPDLPLIMVWHFPKRGGAYKHYYEARLNADFNPVFPNHKSVFPDKEGKPEELNTIGFNPSLLARLQKAMGCAAGVSLEFYGEGRAIVCKPKGGDYTFCKGLIMPVIIA